LCSPSHKTELLLSAKIRPSAALVYLLWEQQHSEATLMALRLLISTVRIQEAELKKQVRPAKVVPILPVQAP
jgi:hypothetical protein